MSHGLFWVEGPEGERLRKEMDDCQVLICRGPGPLWQKFADSLPGYRAAWGSISDVVEDLS